MIFLVTFAVIFIIILAFKPNTKRTKVTKVDENGNESIEYHETHDTSAAGCAAKVIVFPILAIIIIAIIIIASSMWIIIKLYLSIEFKDDAFYMLNMEVIWIRNFL